MPSSNLQDNLLALFEQQRYQAILDQIQQEEVTPASDPHASKIVAAALFHLGRYSDCLLWCEGISPSLGGDPTFASMHGAVLRRLGQLEDAEKVFRESLDIHPEDPFLRNNFANLLIDRQAFDEAQKILEILVKERPDYQDAQANLNRLSFQRGLAADSSSNANQKSKPKDKAKDKDYFADPLLDAFSDEEVGQATNLSASKPSSDTKNKEGLFDPNNSLPSRSIERELQETLTLARQTIDSAPEQCINDCRLLHEKLGIQASIYSVAGEAYIQMKLFSDAELSLLNALSLGSNDASVLLNLANLASMRGDQKLAIHWLDLLAQRQPDHPQLDDVKRTLFPKGAPFKSSNPFQINKEQAAPGSFS